MCAFSLFLQQIFIHTLIYCRLLTSCVYFAFSLCVAFILPLMHAFFCICCLWQWRYCCCTFVVTHYTSPFDHDVFVFAVVVVTGQSLRCVEFPFAPPLCNNKKTFTKFIKYVCAYFYCCCRFYIPSKFTCALLNGYYNFYCCCEFARFHLLGRWVFSFAAFAKCTVSLFALLVEIFICLHTLMYTHIDTINVCYNLCMRLCHAFIFVIFNSDLIFFFEWDLLFLFIVVLFFLINFVGVVKGKSLNKCCCAFEWIISQIYFYLFNSFDIPRWTIHFVHAVFVALATTECCCRTAFSYFN